MRIQILELIEKVRSIIKIIETRSFCIISFFFFLSYWFFSFFVLLNKGLYWQGPIGTTHNTFDLSVFDKNFFESILYNFSEMPLYSILTWLLLKTDLVNEGFIGYMIFNHILGYYAIFCIYRILNILKVNKALIAISLSMFVFNPGYYLFFSSGWQEYPSMCLLSILTYHFVILAKKYTHTNIITCFVWLTLLVSYKSIFHPLLFMLPTIMMVMLIHKKLIKKILLYAIIPLLIGFFPHIKNYIIFDTFSPAIGSFAVAFKAKSFEYQHKEKLLPYLKDGTLSPLIFCYHQHTGTLIYDNLQFNSENCWVHCDMQKFLCSKVVSNMLKEKPYLKTPLILNSSCGHIAYANSLYGLCTAKQLIKDATQFLVRNPIHYLRDIKNAASQYFRTNNAYELTIANNWTKYPLWFGSPKWNLDFFKINSPESKSKCDINARGLIIIFILIPLIFALFYACGRDKNKKIFYSFYLYSFIILSIVSFSNIYRAPFKSYIVSLAYALPLAIAFIRQLIISESINFKRVSLGYMASVYFYYMTLLLLITGSEEERYRFVTDGLAVIMFLFFIQKIIIVHIKRLAIKHFPFISQALIFWHGRDARHRRS